MLIFSTFVAFLVLRTAMSNLALSCNALCSTATTLWLLLLATCPMRTFRARRTLSTRCSADAPLREHPDPVIPSGVK